MNCKYDLFKHNLNCYFKKIFLNIRGYFLLYLLLFIIAFITGIFTASRYIDDISYDNMLCTMLIDFLKRDKGIFSLFFSYSIWYLTFILFIVFFNKNIFCGIVNVVVLFFFSYIIGFDLCVIIVSFGLTGIIFGVFVYGLFSILAFLSLIIIISLSFKRFRLKYSLCGEERKELMCNYILFAVLGLASILLACILLSIMHIFVIIG